MCQSKSNGGIRCENHVKKAIAEHQIAYSNMVHQECVDKGINIDPASLELTSDETAAVRAQVNADPSLQKAREAAYKATQNFNKIQHMLTEALASDDINSLATLVREYDPEFKSINDDNESRKLNFAEDMAKAANDKEKDEAAANNKDAIVLLNARRSKLNGFSKQQAIDSFKIYRATHNSERALSVLKCLQDANRNALLVRDASFSKVTQIREQISKLAIAKKLINDPGYQKAESSPSFRNSSEFRKWNAREKELHESYRMTSAYQRQAAAKISSYKKAGMDITEMKTAYKALVVRKEKFAYNNIAEVHGASSPEAKLARDSYDEANQKEYSF